MQPKSLFQPLATAVVAAALLAPGSPAAAAGRPIQPEDFYRFKDVSDLAIARDGSAVAYLVTSYDRASDESRGALWLVDWNGTGARQLTHRASVSSPRFAPDGRVSFLRAGQLWSVDRHGGSPRQLSHVAGEIDRYEWSPDGRQVVLVVRARGDSRDEASRKPPRPLVIDTWDFKDERLGYRADGTESHLYLLDVRSGTSARLTRGAPGAETLPAFSPDGRQIAYVVNDFDDPPAAGRDEIRLVAAHAGSTPRQLASIWSPNYQRLEWSPDGRQIAFLVGNELKYNVYIQDHLYIIDVSSGAVRPLTDAIDRAIVKPHFTADGQAIQFAVEDDRAQYVEQLSLSSGAIERLSGAPVVTELVTAAGHTAVLAADDHSPFEVYALEHGQLRALSSHNRELFGELALGPVEDISFRSADGTEVHGMLVKPPDYVPGRRYPTIVWLHGGPVGQDDHSLLLEGYSPQLDWQLFATHGYVVVAVNYRGSSGRGADFARSIAADWGHKEVEDLLAVADYAVAQGIADPGRLGIGGWSYGAILTDYAIASDPRFKAAIAGAGSGNQLAEWGTNWNFTAFQGELGPPWQDPQLWLKLSYPLFHAERIRTPTLFMAGDRDFNVSIAGSEQMYAALRTLGVPTQLIVYPGEAHVPARPSFLVDHYRRYLEWMARYLGPGG